MEECVNSLVTMIVFGLIISTLGIINMTGNISSIHWYHRKRVIKEDYKKYGSLVGIGTLIIGVSLILDSLVQMVLKIPTFDYIAIFGFVIGIIFFLYAQVKYNKGIF